MNSCSFFLSELEGKKQSVYKPQKEVPATALESSVGSASSRTFILCDHVIWWKNDGELLQ